MGTDIHMAAEVRRNGKWELVTDRVFRNPWYEPDPKKQSSWNKDEFTNRPYEQRNYDLFAILADVRNGTGFAGCITGDQFNPISEPKGYPEDMCDELRADLEDYNLDYYDSDEYNSRPHLSNEHSASYLTLQELLDYDWTQPHCSIGYLSQEAYAQSIYQGKYPECWSGDVWGRDVVKVSEEEMKQIIEGKYPVDSTKRYYVQCTFPSRTYAEESGSFYKDVLPVLKTLIPEGGTAEDVRIVFDFDS